MRLLLYGLQRSGTNYLERLLRGAYRVRFANHRRRNHPGHKHFRLYDNKALIPEPQFANSARIRSLDVLEEALGFRPDAYLVLSKDPYSWLRSYEAWARTCGWPSAAHHYGAEYTAFYGAWCALAQDAARVHFVRYADLLADPEGTVKAVAARIEARPRRFRVWSSRRVPQSGPFTPERRAWYAERRYLEGYTAAELAALNAEMDAGLLGFLGYRLEGAATGAAEQ